MRSSMLEVLNADYIKTAKSKGLSERVVIYKHALRNAILPVVSYLGPLVAGILTGSFIIEKIFAIPGLGSEFVVSITNRDYTVIMGTTVFFSVLLLVSILIVDLIYGWIDPRIKVTGKGANQLMTRVQLEKSDFEPLGVDHAEAEKIVGKSTSYWKDAWRRFRENKLAVFGVIIIILLGNYGLYWRTNFRTKATIIPI